MTSSSTYSLSFAIRMQVCNPDSKIDIIRRSSEQDGTYFGRIYIVNSWCWIIFNKNISQVKIDICPGMLTGRTAIVFCFISQVFSICWTISLNNVYLAYLIKCTHLHFSRLKNKCLFDLKILSKAFDLTYSKLRTIEWIWLPPPPIKESILTNGNFINTYER